MDTAELVAEIVAGRAERGFVTDPLKIYLLLAEEVGEIAGELKRLWSQNYEPFETERLADEIADVFCLLAALANEFEIDLETAVRRKVFDADGQRRWRSAADSGNNLK